MNRFARFAVAAGLVVIGLPHSLNYRRLYRRYSKTGFQRRRCLQ